MGRAFFFKLRRWNENKRHAFASNCFQRLAQASSAPFVFHASVGRYRKLGCSEFAEFMEFALCAATTLELLRFILIIHEKSTTIEIW